MVAFLAIGLVKISVLEFYKRIFNVQKFRIWANAFLLLSAMWILAAILVFSTAFRAFKRVSTDWLPDSGFLDVAYLELLEHDCGPTYQ